MTNIDQLPPHDIDLELSLLATCFVAGGEVLGEVVDLIEAQYFYKKANETIFRAILEVSHTADSVDTVTIAEHLKSTGKLDGVGGVVYLAKILDNPIAVDPEYSCKKLEEKFLLRKTIEHCYSTIKRCHKPHGDFDSVVNHFVESAHVISDGSKAGNPVVDMKTLSMEASDVYGKRYQEKRVVTGVPTGLTDLDLKTFGQHPGDLTILAGRPGMGKTALMLNMAKNSASKGYGVLILSLEMPMQQLFDRWVAEKTGINGANIRIGNFTPKEFTMVNDAIGSLYKLPIYIDDRGGLDFVEIRKVIRRQIKLNPEIKVVYVDHLQLVRGSSTAQNRNLEIGEITYGLKTLAKQLRIPIIALAQLNRELERRNNPYRRPKLSDLRDSGNIEQDADNVIFIYRPSVYGDNISPIDGKTEIEINESDCELIVAKQRQGSTGTVNVQFFADCQRIVGSTMESPDEIYHRELKRREKEYNDKI